MSHLRIAPLPILFLLLTASPGASGQSVRSTRSGLVYFFDGYVYVEDQQLQPKFGRFEEIGAGRVLRTGIGRAEVLLTPGVILRVDESSAIRMLSDGLSDTRVELLRGSAIVEVGHEAVNPPDTFIYKNWQVRLGDLSIARIDSEPEQIRVLSGTASVSAQGSPDVATVHRGEVLPLASVLLPDPATTPADDTFNVWAMNRSSVVDEDNTIGAGITDDPDQIDNSGVALGGFSYFPPTGIPSLGMTYPYGLSFWGPSQLWMNPYLGGAYSYGLSYPRVPGGAFLYPRPIRLPTIGGSTIGRPTGPFLPRPSGPIVPRVPPAAAPHAVIPRGRR